LGISNIFAKKVERQVVKAVEKELGNASLTKVARFTRGLIRIAGVDAVRKQVIKGIEGDLKRAMGKPNPQEEIESLIIGALATPEYMALLKDLNMGEEHLRLLAKEALQ